MKYPQIIVAGIITAGVIIATLIGGSIIKHRNDSPKTISVKGFAEFDFTSDLAVWSVALKVHSVDPQSGFMTLESQRHDLLQFLHDNGFTDGEIDLQNVTYEEVEESHYDENIGRTIYRKNGYMVSQDITMTSKDITKVDKTSKSIGNLIRKGITVKSYSPKYYYTQLNHLKYEMLAAAAQDALTRATQIAENSNAKVGKLKKSSMGVFQILGKYTDEDYSWGGTYNTSSIQKTATITVNSEFLLK